MMNATRSTALLRGALNHSRRYGVAKAMSGKCSMIKLTPNSFLAVGENRMNFVTASFVRPMPINTIDVPSMGDSITEGTIVDLPVAAGDFVQADDVVVVLETDKVSVDVRTPTAGQVVEILGEIDDVVEVGAGLFRIDTDAEGAEEAEAPAAVAPEPVKETPAAAAPTEAPAAATAPPPPPASKPAPPKAVAASSAAPKPYPGSRTERRTKMSRMRQRVAERLKTAQNTAAMLTTFQEVDMGNYMELRNACKDQFAAKHGVKLGFMSPFVLAATAALNEIPAVNATIDDATMEVIYRDYCDVSVAVASPNGLVVPVLRNTETMSFADVERTIGEFGQKASDGTLSLEEMSGGTFTISNGGVFGSLMSTPILNLPQSAILGMHATQMRPMVNAKGDIVARPMMYLALTYDHRLIDGREAVTFLKSIKEKIEQPAKLLFEL